MSRWKSLKTLRAEMARIERGGTAGRVGDALPLGVAEIDAALGEDGLRRAALHEISGAAADGFAAMLAGRLAGAVLWCMARRDGGDLYPPALATFGLDPSRLVLVRCRKRAGMLSAMEEGLRCSGLAAVLGEADRPPDMIAGRRLQLAAEAGGVTGFMLLHGATSRDASRRHGANAPMHPPSPAASRWRVDHAPRARWRLALLRCRGGGEGAWTVEWNEKTLRLAVVPRIVL
jgi:protein ImuA